MNETGKIERWVAIEVHLVVYQMVCTPARYSDSGQLILGHFLCILVSTPALVLYRSGMEYVVGRFILAERTGSSGGLD